MTSTINQRHCRWHNIIRHISLPRDAMHKRGLCRHAMSVRLSVRLSVTFVDHVKTNKHIFEFFSPSGSILVLPYQTGWRYSDGNPSNEVVECRWGRQKSPFWSNSWLSKIAGRAKCQKYLPTTKLSMTQSATHHWLSIDCWACELRSDKNSDDHAV